MPDIRLRWWSSRAVLLYDGEQIAVDVMAIELIPASVGNQARCRSYMQRCCLAAIGFNQSSDVPSASQ